MTALVRRTWVPDALEDHIQSLADRCARSDCDAVDARLYDLVEQNAKTHEQDCVNLNPATNTMNPRAEAMLAHGLGARPSLGYPGDKYEMGLEAIEEIEVIAAELAAELFDARYAEIRVPSGAIANLYAFMATAKPGDTIIAPPPEIGGHVTHHAAGAAGLYGLRVVSAPVDAGMFTVDVDALRDMARYERPKLITVSGSFNLLPHPVREIRAIADEVGASVLYDAAHMSGLIAGKAWQQPLAEGAHLMTMSTYKSLGGPPSGLVLTNEARLAERLDKIAFPGLTANFDVSKSAALAVALLDWKAHGRAYAAEMVRTAEALAVALETAGLPVHKTRRGATASHQLAIEAGRFGGGQTMAKKLRHGNILASGIGLPIADVAGDMNGLRLGTNEIVRWGMAAEHMPELASYLARVLKGNELPEVVAPDVTAFRKTFQKLHYVRC
ncbi:MAG: aminotransferase class I/II-fold pyridoxal phosphate-dependent enzyme [Hyphomicrobiaceae bacterium]